MGNSFGESPTTGPENKSIRPGKLKIRSILMWFGWIIGLSTISAGGYYAYKASMHGDEITTFNIIPVNAIYVLESREPLNSWNLVRKSRIWNHLKNNSFFGEINSKAIFLDSLIDNNKQVAEYFGSRTLTISAHPTGLKSYDFLYIMDMEESKITKFQGFFKPFLEELGNAVKMKVTTQSHKGVDIIKVDDPKKMDDLYIATLNNLVLASYSVKLIYASIDEQEHHRLETDPKFFKIRKKTAGEGSIFSEIFNVYVQFGYLDEYMRMYSDHGDDIELYKSLSNILSFGGLQGDIKGNLIRLHGFVALNDSTGSYLHALQKCKPGKKVIPKIASARTAMYLSLRFDNYLEVYDQYLGELAKDETAYKEIFGQQKKIEKWLDISLRDDFISWIADEIAILTLPIDTQSPNYSSKNRKIDPESTVRITPSEAHTQKIMVLHTKNLSKAKEGLNKIMKKIRKRSPLKFKTIDYKEYEINILEMKGFFKLIFGKMFQKFEKPYFTYIDDCVVFSNDTESLKMFIDDYDAQLTLENNDDYKIFINTFSKLNDAQVSGYLNTQRAFPLFDEWVSAATFRSMRNNEEYFMSAKQIGFGLKSGEEDYETEFCLRYLPPELNTNPDPNGKKLLSDAMVNSIEEHLSIEDSLTKIKHPDGPYEERYRNEKVKIKANYIEGKLHGDFRMYYKNGNSQIEGRYRNGNKVDVWYYYNRKNRVVLKEIYDDSGELIKSQKFD